MRSSSLCRWRSKVKSPLFFNLQNDGPNRSQILHAYAVWLANQNTFNTKLIWGHLCYSNQGQMSNLPLFIISGTMGPMQLKFSMHLHCDQSIKIQNNTKMIWGHLSYLNEGQRSNLPLFAFCGTTGAMDLKFCMIMHCY